jgi:plastocyanin
MPGGTVMRTRFAISLGLAAMVAGCGSGYSSTPTTPSVNGPHVAILAGSGGAYDDPGQGTKGTGATDGTGFSPPTITVNVGDTVTWNNNDSVTHQPTADSNAWSGIASSGGSYSRAFPTAGNYPYHCAIHPAMTGTIIVH